MVENGERVLEELNDSGGVLARYTTENDSYYGTLLHLQRYTGESRFPIYDEIGSARGLIDAGGTVTDTYDPSTTLRASMDTFGKPLGTTSSTPNPYRFGGAWGYITDPNGFLQLGARYLWPEVGRFVSQDPIRAEDNDYKYADNNPMVNVDPEGELSLKKIGQGIKKAAKKVGQAIVAVGRAIGTGLSTALPGGSGPGLTTAAGSGGTCAGNIAARNREADYWYEDACDPNNDYPDDIDEDRRRWGRAAQHW